MFARVSLLCSLIACIAGNAVGQEATTASRWYTKTTDWHDCQQYHFRVGQREAWVVVPAQPREGNPWIWRARFPTYHAEIDLQLVRDGYHLGYVDVGGLFGSPQAIEIGDQFYRFMTEQRALSRTPVLEGVSRGGLFVYNWTAKNPDKVSCIYCDTPVCDFHSWPQGAGDGIGSEAAWKQCLLAYGLSEAEAENYRGLPIHHAKAIADAKIPLLHIVSENDRVVPPKENTYLLRQSLRALGHPMEIISVPEGTEKSSGHHFDHPDPQRVVEFILKNSRR
jgi:sialidase-1